jgi:hypothetical protein
MPLAGTQHGSMYKDREDASLTWYLPAFARVEPSTAFAFAAVEGSAIDASGNPLDTATVTIAVKPIEPQDVMAARQQPGGEYQPITAIAYSVQLILPYEDDQGNKQTTQVPGQVAVQGDSSLLLTFAALLGTTVVKAYRELAEARLGGASVEIGFTYDLAEHLSSQPPPFRPPLLFPPPLRPPVVFPVEPPVVPTHQPPVAPPIARPPFPIARPPFPIVRSLLSGMPVEVGPGSPTMQPVPIGPHPVLPVLPPIRIGPILPIVPIPPPPEGRWIVTTERASTVVALESAYAAPSYKPRYTITQSSGPTRPLIEASELESFDAQRSVFRELTSLGDVTVRYPSLTGVYLSQLSSTVYAIPRVYGIVHGKGGCAAQIDVVADTSSASGWRFQMAFEVAPVVDPVDLAQLAEDLKALPEVSGLTLTVTAPTAMDERVTPTFSVGVPLANVVWAGAADGEGLLLSFEVQDAGSTPALVNARLLLAQLTTTATPPPLFGTIGVRLDEIYTPPVTATVFISLGTTCASNDVVTTTGATLTATNQSPNAVRLVRMRTEAGQQVTINPLGGVLPAGHEASLPVSNPETVTAVEVQRTLALPEPFLASELSEYLAIHAEDTQQTTHPLTVNATDIEFAKVQIKEIDVEITLDALPTIEVPALVLTGQSPLETVNVVVPIEAALTGLAAKLTISVHIEPEGERHVELANDFSANPMFVLTAEELGFDPPPSPPS